MPFLSGKNERGWTTEEGAAEMASFWDEIGAGSSSGYAGKGGKRSDGTKSRNRANMTAEASPMPDVAPVTSATLP
jgi:hypothetical protein